MKIAALLALPALAAADIAFYADSSCTTPTDMVTMIDDTCMDLASLSCEADEARRLGASRQLNFAGHFGPMSQTMECTDSGDIEISQCDDLDCEGTCDRNNFLMSEAYPAFDTGAAGDCLSLNDLYDSAVDPNTVCDALRPVYFTTTCFTL